MKLRSLDLSKVLRALSTLLLLALGASSPSVRAADQTVTGNLAVTGTVDIDGNSLLFGTQAASPGLSLTYADAANDTLTFFLNRTPASWLWAHSPAIAAMRLTSNHELILYNPDGQTPAVTLASSAVPGGPFVSIGGVRFQGAAGAISTPAGLSAHRLELSGGFDSNVAINNTAFLSAHHQPMNRMTSLGTNMYWNGSRYLRHINTEPGLALEIHAGSNAFVFARFPVGENIDVIDARIGTNGTDTYFNMFGGNVGIGTDRPSQKLTVRGGIAVEGPIMLLPQGDLPMGGFTQGPKPTF